MPFNIDSELTIPYFGWVDDFSILLHDFFLPLIQLSPFCLNKKTAVGLILFDWFLNKKALPKKHQFSTEL